MSASKQQQVQILNMPDALILKGRAPLVGTLLTTLMINSELFWVIQVIHNWLIIQPWTCYDWLVGGFNPFETY